MQPVVLLEAPGGDYWAEWQRFIDRGPRERGFISADDTTLFSKTDSVERAVDQVTSFYRNYQSARYVKGALVLRLLRVPSRRELSRLSEEFSDVMDGKGLRAVEPSSQEVEEEDALDCGRIALRFNQREPGRLRQLIDVLNGF